MEPTEQISEGMVLGLLAEAQDGWLSGEALSDKLGLPRVAVFKQIDGLRAKGYRIELLPRRGYRLVAMPDRLTALELSPLLTTEELGRTVHAEDEVDSTNDVARRLADDGAPHGTLVVAESQRHGRGRRGRAWVSPPGKNLLFSLVLRPDLPPVRAPELTLVAAVAVAEVLRDAGFEARIKWPNDVLLEGRKVAGLLTELCVEGATVRWAVLGIGVDVNAPRSAFPPELVETATSLAIVRGEEVPRVFLLATLLASLEAWLGRHEAEGFAPVRERWIELSATLGAKVRAEGVEGVAVDLAEDGALLVRDASGTIRRVVAGDVEPA